MYWAVDSMTWEIDQGLTCFFFSKVEDSTPQNPASLDDFNCSPFFLLFGATALFFPFLYSLFAIIGIFHWLNKLLLVRNPSFRKSLVNSTKEVYITILSMENHLPQAQNE